MPTALRTLPTGRGKAAVDEEATVIIVASERGVWCEWHSDSVLSLTVAILAGMKIYRHLCHPPPHTHTLAIRLLKQQPQGIVVSPAILPLEREKVEACVSQRQNLCPEEMPLGSENLLDYFGGRAGTRTMIGQ